MRKKIHNRQRFSEYAAPPDNTYEQRLFNGEIVNTVKYIINGLTDKEKIIISLSLFEEKTHKEIADMLGTAINSVSTVIARTKEKLRKELLKRGITSQAI
jgi:RNA polymerase sigma-70 factor (ECF subfamily)